MIDITQTDKIVCIYHPKTVMICVVICVWQTTIMYKVNKRNSKC